jgi:murein DD-endopeptidase MepM/ murein hydrolase activator NlpD
VHVVRSGETVSRIAARHRVSPGALMTANRVARPTALRPGQRLALPGCHQPVETPAQAGPGPAPGFRSPAVELAGGGADVLVARVGPRRIPTRLHIAVPDLGDSEVFAWPVDGPVLSGFGRRRAGWHAGVDIRAERGTPVRAAAPGVVIFSGWETFYGNLVRVWHQNGFITLYAHNHENLVQVGDQVDTDTVIAVVGRTGRATAEHLHFEIRRDGMAYNPVHLLESREAPILAADSSVPPDADPIPVSALLADEAELP